MTTIAAYPGFITGSFPPVSNAADFICDIEVVDDETDEAIDLADATITVAIHQNGTPVLTASTGNGKITLPADGIFRFTFTDDEMGGLCAATYRIGVMLELDDVKYQLLLADLPVVEGIGP